MATKTKKVTVDKKWLDMLADMDTLAALKESHGKFVTIWNNVKTAIKLDPSGFGKWLLESLPTTHALYARVKRVLNPVERNTDRALTKVFSTNKAKLIELLKAEGYTVTAPKKSK